MLDIDDLERKVDQLPLLPEVVVRLLRLNSDDEDFFDQVLELAQQDPTFALQVIKLSNSAASAPMHEIASLQEAVARVGADAIAGLITSMAVLRVFVPSTQGEKDLWVHSFQVALAAKRLAHLNPSLKVDPNQAYLCGLLHDIGRFVVFDKAAQALQKVEDENWATPEQLIDAEEHIYGFNHAKLGAKVCLKWGLPDLVRRIVGYHHLYGVKHQKAIIEHNKEMGHLLQIVQLADRISVQLMHEAERPIKECLHPSLSLIHIALESLEHLMEDVERDTQAVVASLGLA
jgi:putative nucleotidyltransferase with HDIG domain